MKIHHFNYADGGFFESQKKCQETALGVGECDYSYAYKKSDIDLKFINDNQHIFCYPRGGGYWIWKAYFLNKLLETIDDGDCVFYTDAAVIIERSIKTLISENGMENKPGLLFNVAGDYWEKHWTKRDVFVILNADKPEITETKQTCGGFFLIKKCPIGIEFSKELLRRVKDFRLIGDIGNVMNLSNYPGFREHRHDQSVMSVLGKTFQIPAIEDISQWGDSLRDSPRTLIVTRDRR